MSIEALKKRASLVADLALEDWAFAAAAVGEELEIELADPRALAAISIRIAQLAEEAGCSALVGASALGERLAAAAVALAQNGIHIRRPGDREAALIIDGFLATGVGISSAAWRLKREGVEHAVAAVVISTGSADLSLAVDQLVVLEP